MCCVQHIFIAGMRGSAVRACLTHDRNMGCMLDTLHAQAVHILEEHWKELPPTTSDLRTTQSDVEPTHCEACLRMCASSRTVLFWHIGMAWLLKRPRDGPAPPDPPAKRQLLRRRTVLGEAPLDILPAEAFKNGSHLSVFARRCVCKAIALLGRPARATRGHEITVGSVCSGSEMLSVALDALGNVLAREECHVSFSVPFICEVDAAKRQWCMGVQEALGMGDAPGALACAFADVTRLVAGSACARHATTCRLPSLFDGLVGGFSCKDFSRANQNRRRMPGSAVVAASSSPGKSADTLQGILAILQACPSGWIILENVDGLEDGEETSALDGLLCKLAEMGFDTQAFKINSADYGLPQNRTRLFFSWACGGLADP